MDQAQRNLRTFYTIIATQTLSMVGSQISSFAIGFYVFAETGQAMPLLLVSLFSMLPSILAANVGGLLADRWDRRKLMLIADAGQAACTLLLLVSFASDSFQLWHLYALTFASRLLGSIQGPAFTASITMLVPENLRDRANALVQLSDPAAGIIAPIIAGFVYGAVGVVGVIMVDLSTFVVAALVFVFLRIPQPAKTALGRAADVSVWTSFTAGLRFLWSRKPLFVLMLQASLINFCIGGAMGMGMAYLLSRTGSEAAAGTLIGLGSAGMLVGGIIIGIWGGTRPRIHTVMPAIIFSGICLTLFGFSQSPVTLGAAIIAMLFPLSWANAPLMSIMQAKTPPDMQGRVFAVMSQISMFLTPIAFLLFGHLADNVLEPAVGTPAWEGLAPLLGTGKGAGMAVIYVVAGFVMTVSSALVYALPMVRHLESNLPDFVPAAAAEPVEGVVVEPAPAAGD